MNNEVVRTAKTYDDRGSVVEVSFEPDKEWVNLRVAGVSLMVSPREWDDIRNAAEAALRDVSHQMELERRSERARRRLRA